MIGKLGIAMCCSLAIAATWTLTQQRIDDQRAIFAQRKLLEAAGLDGTRIDPQRLRITALQGEDMQVDIDGQRLATVRHHRGINGYNAPIPLWVGLDGTQRIIGVRVIEHRETPGLGDRIDLAVSPWIRQFEGRSLDDPPTEGWALTKDGGHFDGFTGATITPRAVVRGIHETLLRHRDAVNTR